MKLLTFQPALKRYFVGFENELVVARTELGTRVKASLTNYINVILIVYK